jgi:hypothetical protein
MLFLLNQEGAMPESGAGSQQVMDTGNTERERSPHPSLSRRITRGVSFRKRDHVTV